MRLACSSLWLATSSSRCSASSDERSSYSSSFVLFDVGDQLGVALEHLGILGLVRGELLLEIIDVALMSMESVGRRGALLLGAKTVDLVTRLLELLLHLIAFPAKLVLFVLVLVSKRIDALPQARRVAERRSRCLVARRGSHPPVVALVA